jgi:hypothetical protein
MSQTVSGSRACSIRVVASCTICRSSSVNSAARYSTIQAILGRSWIIHGVSRSSGGRSECLSAASRPPQVGHLWSGVVMHLSMVRAEAPVHTGPDGPRVLPSGWFLRAMIGLALPCLALPCRAGRSGPWSRRTGAPEASATGRDRTPTGAALGPRATRATGTTTVIGGQRNPRSARLPAGSSTGPRSLTTTRSQVRALPRPPIRPAYEPSPPPQEMVPGVSGCGRSAGCRRGC